MSSGLEFVSAMIALDLLRSWNARQDERNCRQEEEFVPFRLPPLPRQDQPLPSPMEDETPEVNMATSASH